MSESEQSPLGIIVNRLDKIIGLLEKQAAPKKKAATKSKEVISAETWTAYEKAYKEIHKHAPPRNAKINTELKQVVDKLGKEAAPLVADFYVRTYNKFYFSAYHPTNMLLKDAEKLYVLWQQSKNRKELKEVPSLQPELSGGVNSTALEKIRKELGYVKGTPTKQEGLQSVSATSTRTKRGNIRRTKPS